MKRVVLIIENRQELRELLAMVLQRDNFETLEAAHGEEALPLIQAHNPSLLLLDLFMPRMDGSALLEILAQQKLNIPVILISGSPKNSEAVLKIQEKYPSVTYMEKPFDLNNLRETVFRLLKIDDFEKRY